MPARLLFACPFKSLLSSFFIPPSGLMTSVLKSPSSKIPYTGDTKSVNVCGYYHQYKTRPWKQGKFLKNGGNGKKRQKMHTKNTDKLWRNVKIWKNWEKKIYDNWLKQLLNYEEKKTMKTMENSGKPEKNCGKRYFIKPGKNKNKKKIWKLWKTRRKIQLWKTLKNSVKVLKMVNRWKQWKLVKTGPQAVNRHYSRLECFKLGWEI